PPRLTFFPYTTLFRSSISLNSNQFYVFYQWGCLLNELGETKKELHFFQLAKDKFQKAIDLSEGEPKTKRADLFWQYALCWLSIADRKSTRLNSSHDQI